MGTEPHDFDENGVCKACEYDKSWGWGEEPTATPAPTAKPTPAPTAAPTEEPADEDEEEVFTEVPVTEVVHGVSAAEDLRMGTALTKALSGIAQEYGAEAEIEVRNADKVLTETEHSALQKLEPSERILVMLMVLGYEDEVQNALAELDMDLSEEAQALIQEIVSRTEAMDADELAAFEALIAELFPVTDGSDGAMLEITLEIRVKDGESERVERYGFVETDEGWIFTNLAIAE